MIIPVDLPGSRYNIILERGARHWAEEHFDLRRRVLLVTDTGVPPAYSEAVAARCREAHTVTVPAGEQSKSLDAYKHILSSMLELGITRADCVVAVGGGMVGDLAGFAAATYMRGVDFYNLPTTLLAQVDASVGGKTAIDLNGVKNAVGAFHQPRAVVIDPEVLDSLPARLVSEGMAEVIKLAVTCDGALFDRLAAGAVPVEERIRRSLRIKTGIVERDERDTGVRRVLNFGHTLGHAIESAAAGELLHGEAVALGMLPMCSASVRERLLPVLESCGLPTRCRIPAGELLRYLKNDKKTGSAGICAVLAERIGSYDFKCMTPEEIVQRWEDIQ